MKTLGLDIGTTTLSAVVLEEKQILAVRNVPNDTFLPGEPWERKQDPGRIWEMCRALVQQLLNEHPDTAAIGVTGQMHGICYVDKEGDAVSPLYTWQDGRGDLTREGKTYTQLLTELTGYPLAAGYGLVTHFYNRCNALVPESAAKLCTIQDYIVMKLAGRQTPAIDATDGASLGLWDRKQGGFDLAAVEQAGLDAAVLPEVAAVPCLGTGIHGIPVYAAIGDNQASFLGAVGGRRDAVLVNIGTGSQVSVFSQNYLETQTMETRPFPGGWLLAGAALCGGRSYALLESFFRQTVKMVTGQDCSAYEAMAQALEAAGTVTDVPKATTTFQGTRKDPSLRGSITGLSTENFTPVHLMHSIMEGMVQELYDLYRGYLEQGGSAPEIIIGSGNGLRRNPWLCRAVERIFGCPLVLSQREEEAACGAAMYAMDLQKKRAAAK